MVIMHAPKVVAVCLSLLTATAAPAADLLLGTQPRGPRAEIDSAFRDLLTYLSKVTGVTVGLRYTESWLAYANDSRNENFDITFDGAAFVSWRARRQQHDILVQVAPTSGGGQHVVVVDKDNTRIKTLDDLIARSVCGRPAPNLATLVLLKEFPNPVRQPIIIAATSYDDAYMKMLSGECEAALMGESAFAKHADRPLGQVVFTSKALPPPAITASPRVTAEQKRAIVAALTSPEAAQHIGGFLKKYANGKPLVVAEPSLYQPHYTLLQNEWGFADE